MSAKFQGGGRCVYIRTQSRKFLREKYISIYTSATMKIFHSRPASIYIAACSTQFRRIVSLTRAYLALQRQLLPYSSREFFEKSTILFFFPRKNARVSRSRRGGGQRSCDFLPLCGQRSCSAAVVFLKSLRARRGSFFFFFAALAFVHVL